MDLSKFKHKSSIQIRFKDIDHMGHVNNANHITYFELARIHYFEEVIHETVNWNEQGVILAKTEINYHRPILLNDHVFVYSRVSKLGNKSYEVEYVITVEHGNNITVCASGMSVQVCYNYLNNTTVSIPDSWRKKVLEYEIGLDAAN
ncbi:MAG: acyl-CoA thioesterase [Bacteroidota bacterium]